MRRLLVLAHIVWVRLWWWLFKLSDKLRLVSFYQPLPTLNVGSRFVSPRVLGRWDAIKTSLPSGGRNGLDIGCNIGFYCFKMAELGYRMWGCEASRPLFLSFFYATERANSDDVHPLFLKLTPGNIETLPRFDCILCMAVFHHWCFHFGTAEALNMLEVVLDKIQQVLFFETAQPDETSARYAKVLADMGSEPERWLHQFFLDRGCQRVETIYSRGRHLIAVYK